MYAELGSAIERLYLKDSGERDEEMMSQGIIRLQSKMF